MGDLQDPTVMELRKRTIYFWPYFAGIFPEIKAIDQSIPNTQHFPIASGYVKIAMENPSFFMGKSTINGGKSSFLMGKSTINGHFQ